MLPEFPTPPSELPTGSPGLEVAAGLLAAGRLGCHMRVTRDSGRHSVSYQQHPSVTSAPASACLQVIPFTANRGDQTDSKSKIQNPKSKARVP